jgi:DNA polymerase-3 subunit delta'
VSEAFARVLGHEYAREGLWRSLAEGRLHHALLIHGLSGVGKRTLAETLARTLVCDRPDRGPCESCSHCRRTAGHAHPDLVIIGRDLVFGIDEELIAHGDDRVDKKKKESERVGKSIDVEYMRILGNWLTRKPWEARRRVGVVVDAERMNLQAANAFLKSLEEPARDAVVLLTSSSPSFLRPTIRSRCASIRLSGVPQGVIEDRLVALGVARPEARFRAQASGGSLARALQTRPPLEGFRDQLLRRFGGGSDAEAAAFVAAATAASAEVDRDAALHLFATLLRDIAVLQSGGGGRDRLIHSEVSEALARAAAGPMDAFALFTKVVEARERVAGNANRLSLWDDLLHDASSGA